MAEPIDLQALCDEGQRRLIATDYLAAENALARAEAVAWDARDWDTLARLYMPLQEARRQRRQRCGEGIVRLDIFVDDDRDPNTPTAVRSDRTDRIATDLIDRYPHGQLLVASRASIDVARRVRDLARERQLYVETFLAATYAAGEGVSVVAIVPGDRVALPPHDVRPIDAIVAALPPHSVTFPAAALPAGERRGTDATYAETMQLWESLHAPFLAAAMATSDPVRRMAAFRETIAVDYACELAHQHLSATAQQLARCPTASVL